METVLKELARMGLQFRSERGDMEILRLLRGLYRLLRQWDGLRCHQWVVNEGVEGMILYTYSRLGSHWLYSDLVALRSLMDRVAF